MEIQDKLSDIPVLVGLKEVMAFFGMTASEFQREWRIMSSQDKADIRAGLTNRTYSY
jgi:hypothetical protein